MAAPEQQLPDMPAHHQAVVARFVAACQADERVLAAFLGGSYAAGTADARSDLDLYAIISDVRLRQLHCRAPSIHRAARRAVFPGRRAQPRR